MTRIPAWFERKFEFTFPVEQYPNVCARLRGTPARLEEMLSGVPHDQLVKKPEGRWSPQEHAGHLLDMEPLWMARIDDFLRGGDTLTVADLTNRRTHQANHNARELAELLRAFRAERRKLLERVDQLEPELFSGALIHPRLKQPMRLVDHLYFVAEHDDHHVATVWELIRGSAAGCVSLQTAGS